MKPPNVANIPQELKDLPQWVAWRYETRDGKRTKIPKNPMTGGNADATKPNTWASIAEALISMETYRLEGIGFVFSENDEFCGIDLDKCLDPTTGELEPWAQRWVDLFGSYTEITPSGTGLHIIIKGEMPIRPGKEENKRGRKRGKFEAYDRLRFFTFTGRVFNGNGSDSISTE